MITEVLDIVKNIVVVSKREYMYITIRLRLVLETSITVKPEVHGLMVYQEQVVELLGNNVSVSDEKGNYFGDDRVYSSFHESTTRVDSYHFPKPETTPNLKIVQTFLKKRLDIFHGKFPKLEC